MKEDRQIDYKLLACENKVSQQRKGFNPIVMFLTTQIVENHKQHLKEIELISSQARNMNQKC